jgi:hypothetical protein
LGSASLCRMALWSMAIGLLGQAELALRLRVEGDRQPTFDRSESCWGAVALVSV